TPERIERAIATALDRYTAARGTTETSEARLTRQMEQLDRECARLAGLLAQGDALPSLLEALRTRERQRADLAAEQAHLRSLQRASVGLEEGALRAQIRGWCADWRELLASEPIPARQLLRKLFVGRLVWTPRVDVQGVWYDYAVETS